MTLLQMLATRPGELVTRAQLLSEIWPGDGVYDEALTQCVYQLRLQLCEAGGGEQYRRLVKTVPKRGYLLVDEPSATNEASRGAPETPAGPVTDVTNGSKPSGLLWPGMLLLLLLVTVFLGWNLSRSEPGAASAAPEALSIAVLPFLPLVDEQRDAPMELGMADTLITRLSSIPQLIVRPSNSVRTFNGLDRDVIKVGRLLQVDAVVEGTIHRSSDELRVTARLLRVDDGAALWADSFNSKFSGVFAVQDQICQQIVASLRLQLQPASVPSDSGGTRNTEAYELFLKGRFHLVRLTREDLLASRDYFQRAVEVDPHYALAWLGLASVNFRLPVAGEVPPGDHYSEARAAALEALSINARLAEGHALLGWVSFWSEHDWAAAEHHFRTAIELNPHEFEGRLGYAHLLSNTGRHDQALVEIRLARQINPLFPMGAVLEAGFLNVAGRPAEGLRIVEEAVRLNGNFWLARLELAEFYLLAERKNEALAEVIQARQLAPDSSFVMATQARILHAVGETVEASALVAEMLDRAGRGYVSPYHLAMAYLGAGESEQALEWLHKAVAENNPMLVFLGVDSAWDDLRDRPEFAEILRQVNLAGLTF